MACVTAACAAGIINENGVMQQDWRRVVCTNRWKWPGDLGRLSANPVLVYLRPPPGMHHHEYLLRPRLALVSVHMRQPGSAIVHTIVRCIPPSKVHPHRALQACVVQGWASYQDMAADPQLTTSVLSVVDLWLAACVCCISDCRNKDALRLRSVSGPQLLVLPLP